jgi:hypothetical protein
MRLKTLAYWASVATLGVVLGVSLQFVKAWTEPASAPPNGNIGAPINTGANTQRKTNGTLQVDNSIVAGNLTAAQKPAALAGKPVTGNVYVNDMYVNNASKWVSQMAGGPSGSFCGLASASWSGDGCIDTPADRLSFKNVSSCNGKSLSGDGGSMCPIGYTPQFTAKSQFYSSIMMCNYTATCVKN